MVTKPGEMTAPRWGVPDWRDESAYPDAGADPQEWRWQFLRRRPDYRQHWLAAATKAYEEELAYAKFKRQTDDPHYPLPEWQLGYSVDGTFLELIGLIDPCWSDCPYHALPHTRLDAWSRDREEYADRKSRGLRSVQFDLNRPLGPQLDRARSVLERFQKGRLGGLVQERLHTSKWPLYLRVLDARDEGQSWNTIARELLRHTRNTAQAGRQVWDQAQQVMFRVGR